MEDLTDFQPKNVIFNLLSQIKRPFHLFGYLTVSKFSTKGSNIFSFFLMWMKISLTKLWAPLPTITTISSHYQKQKRIDGKKRRCSPYIVIIAINLYLLEFHLPFTCEVILKTKIHSMSPIPLISINIHHLQHKMTSSILLIPLIYLHLHHYYKLWQS